ncbi:hypothetical protein IQ60_30130 [Streptomyces europaeiscabiei]|nr:hypothetical protein IQ60_30130 [Streptomyces europaeiscabiei]
MMPATSSGEESSWRREIMPRTEYGSVEALGRCLTCSGLSEPGAVLRWASRMLCCMAAPTASPMLE